MPEIETVANPDAEHLRVVRWNGVTFTKADLEAIVGAWRLRRAVLPPRPQRGRVWKQRHARPLFADEQEVADGSPGVGWPTRLRVAGESPVADSASVPGGPVDAWWSDHVGGLGDPGPPSEGMAVLRPAANDDELTVLMLDAFVRAAPICDVALGGARPCKSQAHPARPSVIERQHGTGAWATVRAADGATRLRDLGLDSPSTGAHAAACRLVAAELARSDAIVRRSAVGPRPGPGRARRSLLA